MSNEIFVDGICEIDDQKIEEYFSRFGSQIINYDSHRHRPTNSCCFALITFVSPHTVNMILHQRPHSINLRPVFVKRLLPSNICSFIERLLPVSSLFVYNKKNQQIDEETLKNYFNTFGKILKFEHDYIHDRLFIEYDDYDSVDKIFLYKHSLPYNIYIHKNILPSAQNTVKYHGTCRRKQHDITNDKRKKKQSHKTKHHGDDNQYQDLLQKTIENLLNCKAQLKNKENDYAILQIEFSVIKDKLDQLLDDKNQKINPCLSCKNHEIIISSLQEKLFKLNEQYNTIKSQHQQLLTTQQLTSNVVSKNEHDTSTKIFSSPHQRLLSTRLNNDKFFKHKENDLSQSNLLTFDIVSTQQNSLSSLTHSRIQQNRITYKYNSVTCD